MAEERRRWALETEAIARWRPPLWPVIVLWTPLAVGLIWLGLVLGGYAPAPAWLATRLGVWMINVHASGGSTMMRAAHDAAADEAAKRSRPRPLVIAVTMLTSLSQETLGEIGVCDPMLSQVGRLAALTQTAGLDGVVASPQEIDLIRRRCGRQFAIVTPGIRAAADIKGDQSRTMAAAEALAAGATYLVVGRPIIAAKDPRAAADRIAAECRTVMGSDPSGVGRHVRGIRGV